MELGGGSLKTAGGDILVRVKDRRDTARQYARLAFWVSMGIPISFMGSFMFLSATDFSINMISMFAFIVTLGIVVDDAVVVGENIYHWRRKGVPPLKAAVAGVREVAMPVVFSVLTNLVSFLPLMFIPDIMGKIFKVIPLVVAAVFGVSLFESIFILPAHLGHSRKRQAFWPLNHLARWQKKFSAAFEVFVRNRYGAFIGLTIRHRYAVLAFGIAMMMGLAGYVTSGRMGMEMFPSTESDYAYCCTTLPYGTSEARLKTVEKRLVDSARAVVRENGGSRLAKGVLSDVANNSATVWFRNSSTVRTIICGGWPPTGWG